MGDWIPGLADEGYLTAVMWTAAALVLLVAVLVLVRLVRGMSSGGFATGGKSRRRLGVIEATPIDNQRRLLLVRRDRVEHLLLVGGPADVVIEQAIRAETPVGRTAAPAGPATRPQEVPGTPPPSAQEPRPAAAPAAPEHATPQPAEPPRERAAPPSSGTAPRPPQRPAESPQAAAPVAAAAGASAAGTGNGSGEAHGEDGVDEALIHEFEGPLAQDDGSAAGRDSSLEDEMNKLLDGLSDKRE